MFKKPIKILKDLNPIKNRREGNIFGVCKITNASLIEKTGQISTIGEFVFVEAFKQLKAWQNRHSLKQIKMSINLSPVQFADNRLTDKIQNLLYQSKLDPNTVNLEVTEGVFIESHNHLEQLSAIKELGLNLSMDDFGTGYSSLSYLQKYPFDWLKIDRAFVNKCAVEDSSDQQLIKAIVAMAKSLQLKVVAEGVETDKQLQYLTSLGVEVIQGYLFGRPVAAEEFEKKLLKPIDTSLYLISKYSIQTFYRQIYNSA